MIKVALVGGLFAATTGWWWKQVNNAGCVMTDRKEMLSEEKKCFVFYPNVWITPYMAFASNWAWQATILLIRLLLCGRGWQKFSYKSRPSGEIVGHDNSKDYGSKLTQHNNVMLDVWWEEGRRCCEKTSAALCPRPTSWITLYVPPIRVAGDNIRSSVTNSLKL